MQSMVPDGFLSAWRTTLGWVHGLGPSRMAAHGDLVFHLRREHRHTRTPRQHWCVPLSGRKHVCMACWAVFHNQNLYTSIRPNSTVIADGGPYYDIRVSRFWGK